MVSKEVLNKHRPPSVFDIPIIRPPNGPLTCVQLVELRLGSGRSGIGGGLNSNNNSSCIFSFSLSLSSSSSEKSKSDAISSNFGAIPSPSEPEHAETNRKHNAKKTYLFSNLSFIPFVIFFYIALIKHPKKCIS